MESMWNWTPRFSFGTHSPGEFIVDPLSNAIRAITGALPALRNLTILGTMDDSMSYPRPSPALVEPYWQSLECLTVHFETGRPSGGQYFWDPSRISDQGRDDDLTMISETDPPPGYGRGEAEGGESGKHFFLSREREFVTAIEKVLPDEDALTPLFESFGRACSQIPSLRRAQLSTVIPGPLEALEVGLPENRSPWGVWYLSPGAEPCAKTLERRPVFSGDVHHRRLFWDLQGWLPGSKLQNLMRDVGRQRYGNYLVERFINLGVSV
ncbi:hypothetical protein EV126DRAFT_419045 [Verticillium dahliae]|nr:hypothetical protein EV126DRAFT_419045 [Verticillium dahliae]